MIESDRLKPGKQYAYSKDKQYSKLAECLCFHISSLVGFGSWGHSVKKSYKNGSQSSQEYGVNVS